MSRSDLKDWANCAVAILKKVMTRPEVVVREGVSEGQTTWTGARLSVRDGLGLVDGDVEEFDVAMKRQRHWQWRESRWRRRRAYG